MRGDVSPELGATELWNAVAAAMGQGLSIGSRARAELRLAPDAVAGHGPAFEVATAQGVVLVQIRDLPLAQMTRTDLTFEGLSVLPPALGEAIVALAVDQLLAVLGEGAALVQGVTPVGADGVAAASQLGGREKMIARIDGGWGAEAELLLVAEGAVLTALAARLPRGPAGHWPDAIAQQITLPCGLRMVGRQLSLGRFRGLCGGDIILPVAYGLRLVAPHACFELAQDETNWTIAEVAMNDDIPDQMAQDTTAEIGKADESAPASHPASAPMLADINDVPIRLSFLLADRMMTLAEVQGLAKGAVVPFGIVAPQAGQPVRILANGKPVGEGHIVEVEGQAAVRIASLFGQG